MRNLIPGLPSLALRARWARRAAWLLRRDERGAVGTIVAILLVFGVLTGMGALVIDVGQIYQNRAELQNGADAAAVAVAKSCALGSCNTAVAQPIASQNAKSGTEGISQICGSGTLGTCPASTGALIDCPAAPSGNYVDVHTMTAMPSGSNLLPPVFGRALYGNSSYQGTTVYACAQAEWGAPATATAVPVTVPACVWDTGTGDGASYPSLSSPPASADMVLQENGSSGSVSTTTGCSGGGTQVSPPGGGESFNINPGDTVEVGYDFTIPGNNSSVTVTWTNPTATVNYTCPNGSAGSFTINMPNYTVTATNGSSWYPSGDESSPASYEGSITAPAGCGAGQTMHMTKIATFSASVSCPSGTKLNYRFHDSDNTAGSWSSTNSVTCGGGSSAPAVFSFTTDAGNCAEPFTTSSYSAYSGSGFPADCESALATSQTDRSPILIPVCATGCITGSSSYTLTGFAAFVVTGYNLPGFTASDWLNPSDSCSGSEYCIDGYFTQDVVPAPGTLGGQNMGATIVKLSG